MIGYGVATGNLAAGATFLGGARNAAGNLAEIGDALGRDDCIWRRFAFISATVSAQLGWSMKRVSMSRGSLRVIGEMWFAATSRNDHQMRMRHQLGDGLGCVRPAGAILSTALPLSAS